MDSLAQIRHDIACTEAAIEYYKRTPSNERLHFPGQISESDMIKRLASLREQEQILANSISSKVMRKFTLHFNSKHVPTPSAESMPEKAQKKQPAIPPQKARVAKSQVTPEKSFGAGSVIRPKPGLNPKINVIINNSSNNSDDPGKKNSAHINDPIQEAGSDEDLIVKSNRKVVIGYFLFAVAVLAHGIFAWLTPIGGEGWAGAGPLGIQKEYLQIFERFIGAPFGIFLAIYAGSILMSGTLMIINSTGIRFYNGSSEMFRWCEVSQCEDSGNHIALSGIRNGRIWKRSIIRSMLDGDVETIVQRIQNDIQRHSYRIQNKSPTSPIESAFFTKLFTGQFGLAKTFWFFYIVPKIFALALLNGLPEGRPYEVLVFAFVLFELAMCFCVWQAAATSESWSLWKWLARAFVVFITCQTLLSMLVYLQS